MVSGNSWFTYWIFVIGHVIKSKKAEESIKQITKQIEAGVLNLRRREAATNKKAWIKRHKIISRRNRVNGYVSSVSSSGSVVRWKPERYDDSNEDSDDSDDDSDLRQVSGFRSEKFKCTLVLRNDKLQELRFVAASSSLLWKYISASC